MKCGREIADNSQHCPVCGAVMGGTCQQNQYNTYNQYGQSAYARQSGVARESTLVLVAFIFSLIRTIAVGWLLIPLAWMLPMTIMMWQMYKGQREISVAFGVCSLIFVSLVAGILLLVEQSNRK